MKIIIVLKLFIIIVIDYTFAQVEKNNNFILCQAYEEDSNKLLEEYFIKWSNEIKPISVNVLNELDINKKTVYSIFTDFQNFHISEYYSDFLKKPYTMIQNEIIYIITNSDTLYPIYSKNKNDIVDTLLNFRPMPDLVKNQVVYVNNKKKKQIDEFIKSDCCSKNENKYLNLKWRGWPRANFIETKTTLKASLWGFKYYSIPYVEFRINKSLNKVLISANNGSTFTEYLFELKENKWTYIETVDFLIE
ncbi:MAG: hypothetical protein IPH62_19290 [Ignavibacteriae bacterium]|nr:hypothetical protein [Ignavibacteriota bacterium]